MYKDALHMYLYAIVLVALAALACAFIERPKYEPVSQQVVPKRVLEVVYTSLNTESARSEQTVKDCYTQSHIEVLKHVKEDMLTPTEVSKITDRMTQACLIDSKVVI
jgi:hypothetical protein